MLFFGPLLTATEITLSKWTRGCDAITDFQKRNCANRPLDSDFCGLEKCDWDAFTPSLDSSAALEGNSDGRDLVPLRGQT